MASNWALCAFEVQKYIPWSMYAQGVFDESVSIASTILMAKVDLVEHMLVVEVGLSLNSPSSMHSNKDSSAKS